METEQYRKAALEIIHEYYYTLPNNGYLNHGLLSCDRRYKEAIQCAIIGVKRLILTLEFMSVESSDPAIMDRINFYDKVQDELYKMQADNSKVEVDEYEISEDEAVAYFEQAEKMNKAREYSSPLLEELINETTPEELEKINKEMEDNKNDFQVYTLIIEEDEAGWTHWAVGLTMYIVKNGVTMELDGNEVQQLVKTLPRTFGGSY